MIVRPAVEADVHQLCEIARTFIEESDHGWIYSREVSQDTWRRYIEHDEMVVLMADQDGVLAGGAVVAHDRDFTLNRIGYLVKFYVLPAFRKTRAAVLIAKACAEWFDAHKCWASFATATAGIGADEAFVKLMQRQGYEPCGPTLMRKGKADG